MSFTITTKLSTINDVTNAYKNISLSISLIKEQLAVLEEHEYMGVPVWDEGDDPKLLEQLETLHKQVYTLEKFKQSLSTTIKNHFGFNQ